MSNTQPNDLINQSINLVESMNNQSINQSIDPSLTMESPSSPDSHQSINDRSYSRSNQSISLSKPLNNEKSLLMSPMPLSLRLPETVNSSIGHSREPSPNNQPMSVTVSPIPNQSIDQSINQGLFPPSSPQNSYGLVLDPSMSYWNNASTNQSNQSTNQFPSTPSFDSAVTSAALAASAFAHHPAIQSINQSINPAFKQETENEHRSANHLSDQRFEIPHLDLGDRASSADQSRYQYQSINQSINQSNSQSMNHNSTFGTSPFMTPAFAPMNSSNSDSHPLNQSINQSPHTWSPLTPLLATIHSLFDGARRLSRDEEQAWRSLMDQSINQSNNQFARAQAEISELRQTFDGFLAKLAHVFYTHQSTNQSTNQSMDDINPDELRSHVESIAAKFCKLRGAILNSALAQASMPHSSDILPAFEVDEQINEPVKKKRGSKARRNYFDKRSTRILKEWLAAHMDDPYPNAAVKSDLAARCGLTYDQIGHWFINSRMRIWRPMLRRGQVPPQSVNQSINSIPVQANTFPQVN